ncbi:MAG: hypothetical protein FWG14_01530, partial [Peptococcaceae bacterium]|nr:hypothetical protein [Peptococcaceae bacterium]
MAIGGFMSGIRHLMYFDASATPRHTLCAKTLKSASDLIQDLTRAYQLIVVAEYPRTRGCSLKPATQSGRTFNALDSMGLCA